MNFLHWLESKNKKIKRVRSRARFFAILRLDLEVENGFPSRGQLNMNYHYFMAEDETDPVPATQWFKGKVFSIHATKTYRRNRGTTLLILNLGTRQSG
jgi:hypothetical protein